MQEGSKKIVRTSRTIIKRQVVREENDIRFKHTTEISNNDKNYTDIARSQISQGSLKYSKASQPGPKEQLVSGVKSDIQFFTNNDFKRLEDQLNQIKIMELSEDIRQKLIKLQRFDRLNYLKETQKILKQPIQAQMRRLQKIKNQKKQMRSKYYDNELTVTCLHYHHKLISQYSQLSSSLQQSKQVKVGLQKRIYQLQNQLKRQKSRQNLKPLQKSGSKSSMSSQNQFSKQLQTSWNFSLSAINNEQFPQAIKQMNFFIQKARASQTHSYLIKLMEQTIQIINVNLAIKDQIKKQNKEKSTIVSNVQQLNKYIRQQKWGQVQKIKNRLNAGKEMTFLSLLIESICQHNLKLRSSSNQKLKNSKHQMSKSMQSLLLKQKKQLQQQVQRLKTALNEEKNKSKLEKKISINQRNQSESSSTPSKVNVEQLRILQADFNQLSRLKEEEQFNFLKIIEDKQQRIKQNQQRLAAIDRIRTQNTKSTQMTIEVQEKEKQILALKKQLIKALQQRQPQKNMTIIENKNQTQKTKVQKQMESACNMLDQILKIKAKKQQQIRGKAFELQLNSLQRQQWRQISKKIKEYKKIQPKNKYMNYIDQKHKREFDLVQKLIDYQDKSLFIHNHVYKAISITNTVQGWWNNKEALFCKDKTQFANLFNKLMQRLFQTYSAATFSIQKKQTDQSKQYEQFRNQIQHMGLALKELQKQTSKNDKILLDSNYLVSQFNLRIQSQQTTIIQELVSSFQGFLKVTFQFIAKYIGAKIKQFQLTKKQIEILKLSQTNLRNQNNQITKKLNLLAKQKDNAQKGMLNAQKLQAQNTNLKVSVQQSKRLLKEVQEQSKRYLYYKELIEEQQRIIQIFMTQQESSSQLSSSVNSQMTIKQPNYGNLVSTPKSKLSVSQNSRKQQTTQFLRKYPKNKTIQYLLNITSQSKRFQKQISSKSEIIEEFSISLDFLIQNFQSRQISNLNIKQKHSHILTNKIQKLGQALFKQFKIAQELKNKNMSLEKQLQITKFNHKQGEQQRKQIQFMRQTFFSISHKLSQSKEVFQNPTIIKEMYQLETKRKNTVKFEKHPIKNKQNTDNQASLLDTILSLLEKFSQIHINYEGDLVQKVNQNQAKFKDELQRINDQRIRVVRQLEDTIQKLKSIEKQNKGLVQSESAYLQIQNSYQQLKQTYNRLSKSKSQDQSQIRQLQVFKKQLEEEKNLIDKILKGNNDQEKKEFIGYKKMYPKSKFILYADSQNKKISTYTTKISSLENQSQKVGQFYNKLHRMMKQDQSWFKKDFNDNLPGQIGLMFRELVKMFSKSQHQNHLLNNQMQLLQQKNLALNQQSKQFKNITNQIGLFSQILQITQKSIQKPKEDLFTNQFYLKNLIDAQIKKKKLNFEPIYTSLSEFVHQLSAQYSNRQGLKNQQHNDLKKKMNEQKQTILKNVNQLNLKCKQMEIINKQLTTQNKLIKQSLLKLESSSIFLDQAKKSLETNERTKQYEILRLRQTIETYVKQQTRLQMQKNKAEKDKKQLDRQLQKIKRQFEKVRQEYHELKQEKKEMLKIIQSIRQNSVNLQNSNQQNQSIIATLKQNYNEAQRQLKSIQFRVTSLLQEKQGHLQQIKSLKSEMKAVKIQSQRQLNNLKGVVQKLEAQLMNAKRQCEGHKQKNKHHEEDIQIQKTHLEQIIKKQEKQFSQSAQIYQKQRKQLARRIQILSHQKQQVLKEFDSERASYRQKILQFNLIGSNQTDIQHNNLRKQIEDLNKKYQQNIKHYQLEKQELRKYIEKNNSEYQESLIKNNSEKKKITDQITHEREEQRKNYQHQINDYSRKLSDAQSEVDRLVSIIEANRLNFNQILGQNIKLQKRNVELQIVSSKLQEKIANLQRIINENEQNLVKLGPLQRKIKQFQSLVHMQTINTQVNSRSILQAKLNQLQHQKKNSQLLSFQINKLKCEIQRFASQNQLVQSYSKSNRQEYLKFMNQSKQNIRDLKEQNKFLVKQKNAYQNQLNQLNYLVKSTTQKNQSLSQQLKKKFYEAQVNPIEGQLKLKVSFAQMQLKQKQSQKLKLQNQLLKQKARQHQLSQQNNRLQKRNSEISAQLKELQYRSQLLQQRQNFNNSSQINSFNKQISDLKTERSRLRMELETQSKVIQSSKKDYQQCKKQLHRYQYQIQSINKISTLEFNHLKEKNALLEDQLKKISQTKKSINHHLQNTYVNLNKDIQNKVRDLQFKLQNKTKSLQASQSIIKVLQKSTKEIQRDYHNCNRLVQQLQRKNQQKLKEINQLSKQNMQLDIKHKQIQRNWKYFQVQTQRGIQLQKNINKQLQDQIQSLQKQIQKHQRQPFSPSTYTSTLEFKDAEQQKISLLKQINKLKAKKEQTQIQNQALKKKINQYSTLQQKLTKTQLQIANLKSQQGNYSKTIETLSIKNSHLLTQNNEFKVRCRFLQQENLSEKQHIQIQRQKFKNSERVLQHEIMEFKSKLENVQSILKDQKQKTYNLRMQLQSQRYKQLGKVSSQDNSLRYVHNLQIQSERYQANILSLQKRCYQTQNQLKNVLQALNAKQKQNQDLRYYLNQKEDGLRQLKISSQQNIQWIVQQNSEIKQLLRDFQQTYQSNKSDEEDQQKQLNILVKISSQIQKIISKNKQLQHISKGYKEQLTILSKNHQNRDSFANLQSVRYYLQNMIDRISAYIFLDGNLDKNTIIKEFKSLEIENGSLQSFFSEYECYIRYLFDLIFNQFEQDKIVVRYQKIMGKMKQVIKNYLKTESLQLRNILEQMIDA